MVTDAKARIASISRESRYLSLIQEIERLAEYQRREEAPLLARIARLESEIRTTEISLRMSLEHRKAAENQRGLRATITEDDTGLKLGNRALGRARKQLDWVRRTWMSVLQSRRSELDRIERSMGPGDNLLRASEIGHQQAELPPGPLIKHEP